MKSWMKRRRKLANPRNDWTCLTVLGVGQFWTASTFDLSIDDPSGVIVIPRNSTILVWKKHFEALQNN